MTAASPLPDPEVAGEQDYLDGALTSLAAMRQRAERLLSDLVAAGNPDLDYVAALSRRVALLADSPRPLLFGRIDEEDGPTWHIGRRHVEDERSDPVVVDWRAPVAVPFYRASVKDPLGLARRRQIMVDRHAVVAVADDLFGAGQGDAVATRLRGGDALLAELERARTGEMLDIVATIQAEQDEIIRAPLDRMLTVQGGPGTGKTAVGLHRAAFLLYNHPGLSRDGVLVLGPSRAFLRYIAQVLPSLGEEAVVQTTIGDIAPKTKIRATEPMAVRRLKGDPRMGELLRRALEGRRRPLAEDVTLRARFARGTLHAAQVNELVATIAARRAPYKAGRLALRARLVSEARRVFRASARLGADEAWFEGELTRSDEFVALLDTLWPTVSPAALVRDLLSSRTQLEEHGAHLFSAEERQLLLRSRDAARLHHGLERRRSRVARRGGVPHRGADSQLRPHRGRRSTGPHPHAVPHGGAPRAPPDRSPSWATWPRPPGRGPTPAGTRCAPISPPSLRPSTTSSRSATAPRPRPRLRRRGSFRTPRPASRRRRRSGRDAPIQPYGGSCRRNCSPLPWPRPRHSPAPTPWWR